MTLLQENILTEARESAQARVRDISTIDWSEVVDYEALLAGAIKAVVIIVLAIATYRVVKIFTSRMQREVDESDPLVKRLREQRAQTMASLLNNVALVGILVIAALLILANFIDIGPLLATAGILGLAVSFGAQSLVKDIITGGFILMEGQYGIGDVIRVTDTVSGLVEKITLRTTVLRDIHGVVHVIPNGEIKILSNMTKNWSRAVLDIGVAYKEDVDRVIDLFRDIGQEMRADAEFGPLIMEDVEIPGVDQFADSAVVIRIMVKTLPLKQWVVAREMRRRIKKRFDAEGIEIPFPHRTFYWGEGQGPAGDRAAAEAGAASPAHAAAETDPAAGRGTAAREA